MTTRIRCLLGTLNCRGSVSNGGSCSLRCRWSPWSKSRKATCVARWQKTSRASARMQKWVAQHFFTKASCRKGAPLWRGPATTLDIDDTGATAKVAQCCVRRKADAKGIGGVDRNPAPESLDTLDGMPSAALGATPGDDRSFLRRNGGPNEASTVPTPEWSGGHQDAGSPSPSPVPVPVPASPSLSVQVPSPPFVSSTSACQCILR